MLTSAQVEMITAKVDEFIKNATEQSIDMEEGECQCYCCTKKKIVHKLIANIHTLIPQYKKGLPLIFDIQNPANKALLPISNINITIHKLRSHMISALGEITDKPRRSLYCHDCGTFHYKRDFKYVSMELNPGQPPVSRRICKMCLSVRYFQCVHCQTYKATRTPDGGYSYLTALDSSHENEMRVCLKCHHDNPGLMYICTHCGDTIYNPPGNSRPGRDITQLYSNSCGNVIESRPRILCPSCYSQEVIHCHHCGKGILRYASRRVDGFYYCGTCAVDQVPIQQYSYKPAPLYQTASFEKSQVYLNETRPDRLFYGVEIEMEPIMVRNSRDEYVRMLGIDRTEMAKFLKPKLGKAFYAKHDGSISSGIEVVSHPFTWAWLKENTTLFLKLFDEWLPEKKYSCSESGRCGLHVHMTKAAFTTAQLYKFMTFMYTSSYTPFVRTISERKSNWNYATFNDRDKADLPKCAKNKYNASGERYSAVNLINGHTVEVRLFGGPPNFKSFIKNMEFLQSLYTFARDFSMKSMNPVSYTEYICRKDNRNKYMNLIEFLSQSKSIKKNYLQCHKITNAAI